MKGSAMRIVTRALAFLLLACPAVVPAQTTVKYVHTDALGSVVAMTDAAGAIIGTTREYEPYGQQLVPVVQDGPGYTGHVQDAATGLVYMQQRYYDPLIGRFLSVDPVSAYKEPVKLFNRYRYAANNPYKFTDPDGRYECTAGKSDCARVEKAVNQIHEAAKNASSDSRVAQVSQFLGQPGEKNGVVISDKLADSRNLGEATSVDGKGVHIGLNFGALQDSDRLSSVTMHEGSHGVDHRIPGLGEGIRAQSRSALETTEHRASTAQARMFEALNRNEPFKLFSVDGGMNWEGINDQMQRSVDWSCPTPASCNP